MNLLLVVLAILLPSTCLAGMPASVLTLDQPSVVALYTPTADVTEAEANSDGFADFIDDFETYRMAIASTLRGNKNVRFINSSAGTIRFSNAAHAPISRESLSGYGFIVYVPGKAPAIFGGVATDHDVLCELQRLLPQAVAPLNCGPNNSFKPKPLRGSA